jgi:hypothetical protein
VAATTGGVVPVEVHPASLPGAFDHPVRRLQDNGKADPALDPEFTAVAISAMFSRTAYTAFAVGRVPVNLDGPSRPSPACGQTPCQIPGRT